VPAIAGLACVALAIFQGVSVPSAGVIALFWLALGGLLYLGLFSARASAYDASEEARDPNLLRLRGRSPLMLVPTANPATAPALTAVAGALAPPGAGRVLLLTVMAPSSSGDGDDGNRFESLEAAQRTLGQALRASMSAGHTPEALMTVAESPWSEIARVADTHNCEGLVLGRSELADVAGTPLEEILDEVGCDVAFVRAGPEWRLESCKRILVPSFGRSHNRTLRARLLGSLCRSGERKVTWLRVLPADASDGRVAEARRALRARVQDETPGVGRLQIVLDDDTAGTIARHANDADLVVLGLPKTPSGQRVFGKVIPEIVARTRSATILVSRR
jgi:hypothetical protein